MAIVLQLLKNLQLRPTPALPPGVRLRHYAGVADIEAWLELRRKAFARQKVGLGNWTSDDFSREFLQKSWWKPDAMWLAESIEPHTPCPLIGTVTLARREGRFEALPVVHWLAVAPNHRKQGLGRCLLETLEAHVWDEGKRLIALETHTAWTEAGRLYKSLGYTTSETPHTE